MKSKSTLGFTRSIGKTGIAMVAMLLTLFFQTDLFAQQTSKVAPVDPPTGGFNINGELRVNSSAGDWFPRASGTTFTGGSVFKEDLSAVDGSASGMKPDAYNSNDDIFTNGSKFNDYISNLRWFSNSAPDKNDINTEMYHVSKDKITNDQWIFISGDRLSTNGTSYIDFELLQGDVTQNPDGTFTGTPDPDPSKAKGGGRTENDIIISMEYTNGGSKPNVYIYRWKLSGNTWSYQPVSLPDLANNAFAETNRDHAITDLPADYKPFGNTSYQQYAFVEAGVNITYLLNQTGQLCSGLNIKTLWVKTKASASSTAALKDFISPQTVNFTFGTPSSASAGGPYKMCSSDASVNVSGTYSGSATDATWSSSGTGSFSNQNTNTSTKTVTATYTPSTADKTAGSVTLKLTPIGDASCSSKPSTATLTINPAATIDPKGPYKMCTSDGTVNVSGTYGGGATGAHWTTTDGGGSFSNESKNTSTKTVTATYTPSPTELASGATVTLKLTSTGQLSPCAEVSNTTTLTINPAATANAGGPYSMCASDATVNVSGTYGGGATGAHWTTTDGGGSFSNESTNTSTKTVSATYTPSPTELANGATVTLRLSSTGQTSPCTEATSDATLNIKPNPGGPLVSIVTPECYDKTLTVKITNPADGTTYTLTQPGNSNDAKVLNYPKDGATFTGLTFGDGYRITATSDGCVSDPTTCYEPNQTRLAAPTSIQNQPITLEKPVTDVKAVPNPYNNVIRFSLQSDVSGQGTLELYNLLGQKVKTVYQGFIPKGFKQTIDYAVPAGVHTNLIYLFRVGNERKSGILIGAK